MRCISIFFTLSSGEKKKSNHSADMFSNIWIDKSSNSVIKYIQEMSFTTVQFLLKRLTRFFFYSQDIIQIQFTIFGMSYHKSPRFGVAETP